MSSKEQSMPTRSDNFSAWYHALVKKAGLVDDAPVRGCMTLRPSAFALWERIQKILDLEFKRTGHTNAYFPLLIPLSHLTKEADHVEGFAKECAVVTHYRLKSDENQGIIPDPDSQLEEPLVIRPTSETIIWSTYSRWIQSYRDLPLLLNQWANVVRWEMRTRPFLRTAEILWQEGHTAHATEEEARAEARKMHDLYADFIQDYLAIPVIKGEKTAHERFAGAVNTYTLEALMQDGKALQLGTSHFLGQNFSKAFNVRFSNEKGSLSYAWGTSWGVTTRLIGAMIMTHSDDKGLVLPPKIAPIQVVILPVYKQKSEEKGAILAKVNALKGELERHGIGVRIDSRETHTLGWKLKEYELQGIPIKLVLGSRDLANKRVEMIRRDQEDRMNVLQEGIVRAVKEILDTMQKELFDKAQAFQAKHTTVVDNYQAFKERLEEKIPGLIFAHWDETTITEQRIQEETQATIRCIPLDDSAIGGKCIYSGCPSLRRVIFAKAY